MTSATQVPSNQEAMQVAEEAREKKWEQPSFLAQLFAGHLQWNLIFPYPVQSESDQKIGDEFLKKLEAVLKKNVNPNEVDRTGEIPKQAIQALADLGCFGMKIPKEYGGLGLSQVNYNRAIQLVSSYCGSTAVWLSAHQSIGVPQPLMVFGTESQKNKYLPRFAKGAISAFALTEPEVGSDPARMSTTATPVDNGEAYLINGEKLWCTNGPVADILIVMAQTPVQDGDKTKKKITAFIVEKEMPGFETIHRCQFMGLHGIQNGLLKFNNVRVPKENILWGIGKGLKLALVTLNTGRLTIPAASCGAAKWCLNVSRHWANSRNQWGAPVGQHDAVAAKIASMTAYTFAMESITWLTSAMADQKKTDIRLEAAMAKLFCSEASWRITDDTVQIRGGRGYETADSLKARGEEGIPVERAMRDMRINLIIEGTSEIMHLFIAREAMDLHLRYIFPLLNPRVKFFTKVKTLLSAMLFYITWYPTLWIHRRRAKISVTVPKEIQKHLNYIQKQSPRLARTLFHVMAKYQQKLEKKQRLLFRFVNIGSDLFALAAACARAAYLVQADPANRTPLELVDLLADEIYANVDHEFKGIKKNSDRLSYSVARKVLDNQYAWLEKGIISYY